MIKTLQAIKEEMEVQAARNLAVEISTESKHVEKEITRAVHRGEKSISLVIGDRIGMIENTVVITHRDILCLLETAGYVIKDTGINEYSIDLN